MENRKKTTVILIDNLNKFQIFILKIALALRLNFALSLLEKISNKRYEKEWKTKNGKQRIR